jgi:hypothetical protein
MRRNRRRAGSCGNEPHGDRPGGCFYSSSRSASAQADALEIEAGAKRRLADEYDAAQERGEILSNGERTFSSPEKVKGTELIPPKDLHDARLIRDAEVADPALVRDQPTRIAETPARVPGTCLTVVTTAKMTATAKAIERAAKTNRGTIPRSLIRTVISSIYRRRFCSPRAPCRGMVRTRRPCAIRPL